MNLPGTASVVVIGGGVVGCSIAYHLARRGQGDVVVLEREAVGSGTTSKAADGMAGPAEVTNGFARRARELGVRIVEGVTVTGIDVAHGGVRGVTTSQGA